MKNRQVLDRIASVSKPGDTEPIHLDDSCMRRAASGKIRLNCPPVHHRAGTLGVERIDDVPGAMAPSLYFRFSGRRSGPDARSV